MEKKTLNSPRKLASCAVQSQVLKNYIYGKELAFPVGSRDCGMAGYGDVDCFSYRSIVHKDSNNSSDHSLDNSPSKRAINNEQAIEAVRNMILAQTTTVITRMDDDFILRFLRARKMNVEESYQLMCNYFAYRDRNRDLFENMTTDDPLIKQALYDGFPGVLKSRDRRGRCVLLFFCSNWDQVNYPLEVIYRSLLLSLERLIEETSNQANGFVIIVDWTDMSLRQVTSLTPRTLRLMVEGLQDCFPARFKGVHFINQPWYIDPVIAILKAFLKEKTKKKIYVHGNNLSTLHEHIARDILPTELGGEAPPFNPTSWAESMVNPQLHVTSG